jgi:hypothetical protein
METDPFPARNFLFFVVIPDTKLYTKTIKRAYYINVILFVVDSVDHNYIHRNATN